MTHSARRQLTLLTAASALGLAVPGYIHHGAAAIGPFLIEAFSLSKSSYGFLLSAWSLVGALTSPALGVLADRVGGVRLLRWSFFAAIGISIGTALSPTVVVFFVVSMVGGVTASSANPATNTLIGNHVPLHRRGLIVGIKQAGGPLGIAAAGAMAPVIASSWGWKWAVVSGAAMPALGLAFLWSAEVQSAAPGPKRDRSVERPPLGGRIRILAVNAAAIGWGLGAMLGFIAVYGVEEVGMSETAAGAMLTVVGVIGVIARLTWGAIADRTEGSSGLLALVGLMALAAAIGIWASGGVGTWLLVASTVLLGASAMSWNAVGMLAVIREASVERAGAASGVVVFGFMMGMTLGPWAFGTLVDATGGYTVPFAMVALAFALSATVLLVRPEGGRG